ncbi:MAG: hypothetical protein GXP26_02945 [Planctomycetes bacterium]|nr:hypothetical protein [Planctomycetota bacterium]
MATILEPSRESVQQISPDSGSSKFWRSSAPQGVKGNGGWEIWSSHLVKRRTSKRLEQLSNAARSPLGWGLDLEQLAPQTVDLLAIVEKLSVRPKAKSPPLTKASKSAISSWLEGSRLLPQTVDFAMECLAVTHLLPQIVEEVSEKQWWELVDALWQVARSAADWRADAELPPEQSLAQQLLAGELPITLAYLLPEIRPVYKLRTAAHDALSEGLLELLNGDGLMRGSYLGHLRPLLACWTRCRAMGASFKKNCWSKKAEEQFQCLTTHALSLSSATGMPLLAQSNSKAWTPDFLQNLMRLGGNAADMTAAREIFSKKLTRSLSGKQSRRVPETSNHCEWAGLATMRTDWQRDAPTLAIDFSTPTLRLEAWAGTQRLISGAWSWETTIDGRQLEPVGSWEETCWFSDADVDYLELSIDLTGDVRLERQILLARNEMFLLLADYIHGTTDGEIRHQYRLPLDTEVKFLAEKETREGLLVAKQPVARILPLALPEWRSDPRAGELTTNEGQLQLSQQRQGRNLASPLLLDLKKSRATKPCTWRQLTIAQALEIQSPDVAVGYRVQCGKQQWLIYRSLDKPANRTLLGQNLSLECLVARFLAPSGEIDELLEVEG